MFDGPAFGMCVCVETIIGYSVMMDYLDFIKKTELDRLQHRPCVYSYSYS